MSTTATTYPLTKYSRLYPNPQQVNLKSQSNWEHFTKPSICMILDVKKGARIESIRLRILLSAEASVNQGEVIFEDLDLLSLSRLTIKNQKTAGPPIKAVYRDNVVGVRYLNSIDLANEPVYRRFQITFVTSASAVDFINMISTICPCKANPVTGAGQTQIIPAPSQFGQQYTSLGYTQTNISSPFSTSMLAKPLPFSSSPNVPSRCLNPSSQQASDLQLPSSCPASSDIATAAAVDDPSEPLVNCSQLQPLADPRIQGLQQETSLPNSSPPSSSANCADNNSDALPIPVATRDATASSDLTNAIISSVKESASLYSLSRDELERLVSHVVQEDGFSKLLENLDSMLRVKGFLGIRSE